MKNYILLCFICLSTLLKGAVPKDDTTFRVKGFHLDLRVQVMKMPALKAFVKMLSEHGVNTLVMEWEGTYPFQEHAVISNQYAYTREEVKSFIAYCNQLKVDVIPLQQSFGHVEYILKHARYAELREDDKDYSQVNPLKEAACRQLFADLYKDMISTHTSPYIHIGGDETYLLGHGPASKKKADSLGMGRLYGDYIQLLCELVVSLGKRPVVWADIALKYPDALKKLPKETIFIDWNYGWDLNRFGDHKKLQESGFEIWGAPAIRSGPDNFFLTCWQHHFDNISTFIPQSRGLGYKGMIMTSWSTSGVYSPIFEAGTEAVELEAVRRVYPLTGFNLLIGAYLEALNRPDPLDTKAYIKEYCKRVYGFNTAQSDGFIRAIGMVPFEIKGDKVLGADISVAAMCDSVGMARKILGDLAVKCAAPEFKHYLLMADIRAFYLNCKRVEAAMNRPDFRMADKPRLLQQLLQFNPETLNKRFIALNRDIYYVSELEHENGYRNIRFYQLKALLANRP